MGRGQLSIHTYIHTVYILSVDLSNEIFFFSVDLSNEIYLIIKEQIVVMINKHDYHQ